MFNPNLPFSNIPPFGGIITDNITIPSNDFGLPDVIGFNSEKINKKTQVKNTYLDNATGIGSAVVSKSTTGEDINWKFLDLESDPTASIQNNCDIIGGLDDVKNHTYEQLERTITGNYKREIIDGGIRVPVGGTYIICVSLLFYMNENTYKSIVQSNPDYTKKNFGAIVSVYTDPNGKQGGGTIQRSGQWSAGNGLAQTLIVTQNLYEGNLLYVAAAHIQDVQNMLAIGYINPILLQ